jgi:hypothetical protein
MCGASRRRALVAWPARPSRLIKTAEHGHKDRKTALRKGKKHVLERKNAKVAVKKKYLFQKGENTNETLRFLNPVYFIFCSPRRLR